jgi:lipopolysaccharide transport system permease protein
MHSLTFEQVNAAIVDLRSGISAWRLSRLLAWQDIKQRYRRSTLGPIWLTLSSGIQMLTMSFLSSFLFNSSIEKSLPFVCAGMLFWGMITQMINEGAMLFLSTSSYITQIKRPLTIFIVQVMWRNVIVAAHNAVTYVIIAVIFVVVPGPSIILVSAIVSARYRDVPVIIQNVINILFWFTPLMYFPEQLGAKRYLADYNPFTHIIALLRGPLLGIPPTLHDWLAVLAMAVVGWVGAFLFFARFRARIVYWL